MDHYLALHKSDSPFYLVDLGTVFAQFKLWKDHLPNIDPHYAVKCCPNDMIIKTLAALGCGFDCASKTEIMQVLSHNVPKEKIIYANPIKQNDYIKYAETEGVFEMTFDCEEELYKVKLHHPEAHMIIRMKTDDSNSVHKFSTKFGCSVEESETLIALAQKLSIKITGVSFHVGSKCNDADSYINAIRDAREIFRKGEAHGMQMNLLDVGGGFPGTDSDSRVCFDQMAAAITAGVERYFSDVANLRLVSEPGRFFCTKSHTLLFNVIGKKKKQVGDETEFCYYMDEGIYGGFNCMFFDDAKPKIVPTKSKGNTEFKSTMFGPTCDSIDKIGKDIMLPELSVGDTCYVENFGAYTMAAASHFNGFGDVKAYYYISL